MSRTNYDIYFPEAIAGSFSGPFGGDYRGRTYRNIAGIIPDEWLLTVPGSPAANTEYLIKLDGSYYIRYTTGTTPDQNSLRDGILNALRTNPYAGARINVRNTENDGEIAIAVKKHSVLMPTLNWVLPAGFTLTQTSIPATATTIPFGRFLAWRSTDPPGSARLPGVPTDIILGICHYDRMREQDQIGELGQSLFQPYDVMPVVDRTEGYEGMWVECSVNEVVPMVSIPYVDLSAGNEGKVTTATAGNINISAHGSFQSKVMHDINGKNVALVAYNKP